MEAVKRQQMTLISAYRSKKQSHLLLFFKDFSCCILNSKVPLEDGVHLSVCTFPGCGIGVLGMGGCRWVVLVTNSICGERWVGGS